MQAVLHELSDFIYHEAQLLDDGAYRAWLELFAPDGRYWVPLMGAAQSEHEKSNSIADEDCALLALRVERLEAGIAHSQQPASRSQHVLQAPRLIEADEAGGRCVLRTPFSYAESRGDHLVSLYGHYIHRLQRVQGQWRIALKRVNLVNASSRLPMIQLFP